jgi:hypothetical protein
MTQSSFTIDMPSDDGEQTVRLTAGGEVTDLSYVSRATYDEETGQETAIEVTIRATITRTEGTDGPLLIHDVL